MRHWYDAAENVLLETNTDGNSSEAYLFFDGKRVGRWNEVGSPGVQRYITDHLGSSRYVFDGGANGEDISDFYPFGGERPVNYNCCVGNKYKFTSKERDSESGLENFGARYNSSTLGRFMSPDWASVPEPVPYANLTNPQTLNLYAMVSDNPETFADLDGHCGPVCFVAAVVVVAGIVWGIHKYSQHLENERNEASKRAKANQEAIDAALKGDAEKAEAKEAEAAEHARKALKEAQEAGKEGMQMPGTSTGGDLGFGVPDAAGGIILGKAVDSEQKQIDKTQQQKEKEQKEKEKQQQQQNQKRRQQQPTQNTPPPVKPCQQTNSC